MFLIGVLESANRLRATRVTEELAAMRERLVADLPDYREVMATVGNNSTIRLRKQVYSVPSRLIGVKLLARIYENRIVLFHGAAEVAQLPLGKSDRGAIIDFCHLIGHLLRKAGQRHTAIFQHYVGDNQLTAIQFVTLCALRDHGPSSQAELIKATAVDQATIRGIVERLKARELVQLSPDPGDRRKVIVELTESGAALLDAMIPCARQISELSMGSLNAGERVAILYLLRKMIDSDENAG